MSMTIAAQLYTVREFLTTRKDFETSLEKIARMGYRAVQFSAVKCMDGDTPEVTPREARQTLDSLGLQCVSTHRGLDRFVDHLDEEIAFHKALGCSHTAIGGLPTEMRTARGYRDLIERARVFLPRLKTHGIAWSYHNHAIEFQREGGLRHYDILVREAPADFLLEVDTYWAAHAGADPAALLRSLAGRIPVVHFKDMEVTEKGQSVFAPVGEGNLNWDAILDACRAGGTWCVCIEQDACRRDPFDCLKSSLEFLKSKGV